MASTTLRGTCAQGRADTRHGKGIRAMNLLADHSHTPLHRGFEHAGELLDRHVAAEQVHRVGERAACRQLDCVEPSVLPRAISRSSTPRRRDADANPVGHVQLRGDRDLVTRPRGGRPAPWRGNRGAVLKRSAELVVTPVDQWAEEGAAAGSDGPSGSRPRRSRRRSPARTAPDVRRSRVDVVARRLFGERMTRRVEARPGAKRSALVPGVRPHGSRVADLCADRGPLGVDRVGEPAQARSPPRPHPRSRPARCGPPGETAQ